MKRPIKDDYLTSNQFTYFEELNKYYDALEKYCDWMEKEYNHETTYKR